MIKCYINAAIQCLFNLSSFRTYMNSIRSLKNDDNDFVSDLIELYKRYVDRRCPKPYLNNEQVVQQYVGLFLNGVKGLGQQSDSFGNLCC